jgi:hypothetical protein
MCSFWVRDGKWAALSAALLLIVASRPGLALDKPTGAPLVISGIETEQPIALAILTPDGKTAKCVLVRLHWKPKQDMGPNDEATSFDLDIKPDAPGASIFTAQLWSASLASALAWQQPWSGARWKVLDTPASDGSGIDAALAVGMISTSARRLYPKDTVVIGSLNPDGSLGSVSRLTERIDAAAAAGMKRVIIPSVQRFDTDSTGQVVNIVRHATEEQMQCIPVDNLVEATETTMNDPLPDTTVEGTPPKYSAEVAAYIDGYAHREQSELTDGLRFAPKESDLANYPLRLAAIWRQVFAEAEAGRQAYQAGQVYVAYRLFAEANGRMHGLNALGQENEREAFEVKTALAASDDLRHQLHDLMNPPSIDKGELESAVLVAEMADWAYGVDASLEGAQLVTKQAFSQRSDATPAQQTRARDEMLFAIEEAKYLLHQADFYQGLLDRVGNDNPIPVDENAQHLLPQLIPAQLATAQLFTNGILPHAGEMRDGLLFDPRLAAYVNVLRETKAAWDARLRRKEMEDESGGADAVSTGPPPADGGKSPDGSTLNATKLDTTTTGTNVEFDPNNTYSPPHTMLVPSAPLKKISDTAACLIWVNHDCEIATLNEKYLWLSGTIDPLTHEWSAKDRVKLDALLQAAELGARHGIAFAARAEMDPSVLAMIYERASHDRLAGNDATALEALRNYWRCALLGNMCWQLAHTRKAQPVDLVGPPAPGNGGKPGTETNPATLKVTGPPAPPKAPTETPGTSPVSTHQPGPLAPTPTPSPAQVTTTNTGAPPVQPATSSTPLTSGTNTPAAPISTNTNLSSIPVAPIARPEDYGGPAGATSIPSTTNPPPPTSGPTPAPTPPPPPPPASASSSASATATETNSEPNIPVAPIAKPEDFGGAGANSTPVPSNTNAPAMGPSPAAPSNGHGTNP